MAEQKELELALRETQAQLAAAQAHLERAEKLAVLGGILNEIVHEINTPLAALRSNHESLAQGVQRLRALLPRGCAEEENEGDKKDALDALLVILDDAIRANRLAIQRVSNIAQGLRLPMQTGKAEYTRSNIQIEIENTLVLLASVFKRRLHLIKNYGDPPEIECDPDRLGQVFLNLLVNAVEAMDGEGEIRIRTWQEADTVRVAIRDTGKGIPAELLRKIFDPGFTTKSNGTGLGLSICRRIVQQHSGSLQVESEEGKGATFTVILPIRQSQERNLNGR